MIITDKTVFFSLIIGAFLGFLLIILKTIRKKKKGKKFSLFIADFTFSFTVIVVTYIGAIPLTYGRVRLMQVLLELIAMLSVLYTFEPVMNFVVSFTERLKGKID